MDDASSTHVDMIECSHQLRTLCVVLAVGQQCLEQSAWLAAVLHVIHCDFWTCSGSLPNASHLFPQTRVLNIAYNNLTGSIPATFNTAGLFNTSLVSPACMLLRHSTHV